MPPHWKVPGLLQVPQLLQGRGERVSALPGGVITGVHSEGAGYIQTISLSLRTKGFCIVFKESSFHRVKGNTPRTEGAADWQKPSPTHKAEMQGSTDKAQGIH